MEYLLGYVSNFSGTQTYLIVFCILLACGLGLPIPEDITLFAAGYMAYLGEANVWVMIAFSFLGVIIGDSIIFFLGAKYGRRLTNKWLFAKLLPPQRLDLVREKFNQRGLKLLFAARFMPGFRAPIFFSAGTFHIPYRQLLIYDGCAALVSVPAIVYAIYYFGSELERIVSMIKKVQGGILIVILLAIFLVVMKWYIGHRKGNGKDGKVKRDAGAKV